MENGELTLYQTSCKLQFFSHVSYLHTRRIGFLEPAKDMCSKSISSGAQYVTLNKYFPRPNLVIYFLETGTANRWGTTNSKPPGPIIMIGQSETLSSS
jgi:hypothetical protein